MTLISRLVVVSVFAVLVAASSPVALSQAAQESVDERQLFLSLLARAEKGDAQSQRAMASVYQYGLYGIAKNAAEAVKWFRLAAAQGNAYAQTNLGWMYSKGEGVAENDAEAVKWYRLAADQGDALAQSALGWMYAYGEGVPESKVDAYFWFNLAAAQGNEVGRNGKGIIVEKMTREQIAEAQRRSAAWKPKTRAP